MTISTDNLFNSTLKIEAMLNHSQKHSIVDKSSLPWKDNSIVSTDSLSEQTFQDHQMKNVNQNNEISNVEDYVDDMDLSD